MLNNIIEIILQNVKKKRKKKKKKLKQKSIIKPIMKNYEKNRESITKIIPKMRKLKNESMLIIKIKICLMKIEVEKDYRRYYYHKVKKLLDHLINRVEESDNASLIFLNI